MKKFRGVIKNWQLHTLSTDIKAVRKLQPDVKEDKAMMFTGTIVEDPSDRWKPGYHMRSSLILHFNRETGECETLNSLYRLEGEGGNDVVPDLGPGVLSLFY